MQMERPRIKARLRVAKRRLRRFYEYIGAHRVEGRQQHEIERARQRTVFAFLTLLCVAFFGSWRDGVFGQLWIVPAFSLGYFAFGLWHMHALKRLPGGCIHTQYALMSLDAAVFALFLCDAPTVSSILAPYIMFIVTRVGVRYGVRALWFSWCSAILLAAPLMYFGNPFWRTEVQLSLALVVMMALIPPVLVPMLKHLAILHRRELDQLRLAAMEAAMLEKSAFLAKVSHELRSPLQAIVASLELMETSSSERTRQALTETISGSAKKLAAQLSDLLTIARSEALELNLQPSIFDAVALLEQIATSLRPEAQARGLQVRVATPEEPLFVIADSDRLGRVLENLANNAVRYTDSGSVSLAVCAFDKDTGTLQFTTEDTGPGIRPDRLPLSFILAGAAQPRLHESPSLHTGMGLAVVRTLVDLLGGRVEVDTRAGTKVTVTIPCELVTEDHPDEAKDVPRGMVVTADQQAYVRLERLLARMGPAERVANAAVAANRLAHRRYKWVLVDANFPRGRGWHLALDLRRGSGPNRATRLIWFGGPQRGASRLWPFDDEIVGNPTDATIARATASASMNE